MTDTERREAAEARGWRPITTAPRDGTVFFALNHDREIYPAKYLERGNVVFRMNHRREPRAFQVRMIDGEEWLKEDKQFAADGECWSSEWVIWTRLYEIAPTHWMPLPLPPAIEHKEQSA